jgi:hypothetical protein
MEGFVFMEKILIINCKHTDVVKKIASDMRVKAVEIQGENFNNTVENLVMGNIDTCEKGEILIQESMLIFNEFSEKHLDRFLARLRQKDVQVDYKAIVTSTNKKWTLKRLFAEMEKEKKQFYSGV